MLPGQRPMHSLVVRRHTAWGEAANTANVALLECQEKAGKARVSPLRCCLERGTDGLVVQRRRRFGRVPDSRCNRSDGHILPNLMGGIIVHLTEMAGGGRRAAGVERDGVARGAGAGRNCVCLVGQEGVQKGMSSLAWEDWGNGVNIESFSATTHVIMSSFKLFTLANHIIY